MTHEDEKHVVAAITSTWDQIASDYGRTTANDEIGAAMERTYMYAKNTEKKMSPQTKKFMESATVADVKAVLKAHGIKRLSSDIEEISLI